MLPDHAKIMALLEDTKEVIGRKKLQKIVYIGKKLNLPFQEKYTFRMYGPYSEELTLRLEELCGLGLITECKETKSGYYQYRYELSEDGTSFLEKFPLDWPSERAKPVLQSLNSQSARFLELVSTMLYFDHLSKEAVEARVAELKKSQNYRPEEFEEGWEYIESLQNQ
ncbi:YwgA family protein [Marinococcus luteus]|uniref:YwgA family protein n=1 Tax=Marinococcus luteus TaxID=1122204 RepID=UPI002ACC9E0C|nr:YwgA family protein [Marinococcus luteus]MDZ5782620.1 YwgA family protein [Marinococcus luteus]